MTVIETVPQAIASLQRLFLEALGAEVPDWLRTSRRPMVPPGPRLGRQGRCADLAGPVDGRGPVDIHR